MIFAEVQKKSVEKSAISTVELAHITEIMPYREQLAIDLWRLNGVVTWAE